MTGRIIHGHVLDVLASLPERSVHMVVSSPPYFGVRAYGTEPQVWGGDGTCGDGGHEWRDMGIRLTGNAPSAKSTLTTNNGKGPQDGDKYHHANVSTASNGAVCMCCGAWRGELGSEKQVDCLAWARSEPSCSSCYLCHLRMVMRAVWRVLQADGVAFINLGDSYAAGASGGMGGSTLQGGQETQRQRRKAGQSLIVQGITAKNLLLVPQRFALAMQADGWIVRSDVIWSKLNPMPESVRDRFTRSHEYVWMLAKQPRYYFDQMAIQEPSAEPERVRNDRAGGANGHLVRHSLGGMFKQDGVGKRTYTGFNDQRSLNPTPTRNKRTVWEFSTQARPEAHFATFPDALVQPMIACATSEHGCCSVCGAQYVRVTEESEEYKVRTGKGWHNHEDDALIGQRGVAPALTEPARRTVGWRPGCSCEDARVVPCTVLDPFLGSGTTGSVAERMGRNWIGIELKAEYVALAERRTAQRGLWQFAAAGGAQ